MRISCKILINISFVRPEMHYAHSLRLKKMKYKYIYIWYGIFYYTDMYSSYSKSNIIVATYKYPAFRLISQFRQNENIHVQSWVKILKHIILHSKQKTLSYLPRFINILSNKFEFCTHNSDKFRLDINLRCESMLGI